MRPSGPTIQPGLNPGGLWVELCTDDEVLAAHPLGNVPFDDLAAYADSDADLAIAHADQAVWNRIYDGDSGECVMTVAVLPPD